MADGEEVRMPARQVMQSCLVMGGLMFVAYTIGMLAAQALPPPRIRPAETLTWALVWAVGYVVLFVAPQRRGRVCVEADGIRVIRPPQKPLHLRWDQVPDVRVRTSRWGRWVEIPGERGRLRLPAPVDRWWAPNPAFDDEADRVIRRWRRQPAVTAAAPSGDPPPVRTHPFPPPPV
jgi:hypothetical protein